MTQRVITSSEREANVEEKTIASIPWLIDLSIIDKDTEPGSAVKFGSGAQFNYFKDVSIKSKRVDIHTDTTADSTNDNSNSTSKSMLRNLLDSKSITSEITMDSRIRTLEARVDQILKYVQQNSPTSSNKSSGHQATSSLIGGSGE